MQREEVLERPRRVLQIGMGWFTEEPGGLNRMYAGLWNALAAAGTSIKGFVAGDRGAAVDAPADLNFFARRNATLTSRLTACRREVSTALRQTDVDVVAAHFAPYALPVLDLVRGKNFVFHFHGPWAAESSIEKQHVLAVRTKRLVESVVYSRPQRFIVLSHAFGEVLTREYGVHEERIRVVPGGVDAARFAVSESRHDARVVLNIPTGRPVIGIVRRLVHRVGLEGLIEAVAGVRPEIPDVLLLVAGTGPLAGELAARVAERSLQHHVRFMGFVTEDRLPLLYRACDLTIVPSIALEGFGLTTIESLAAGTPVLVTPVGGLPETVERLDPDLVLPDAGAASIAAALTDALTGARKLPSPEHCAQYARAEFDWPVIADKVLAAYA